MVNRASTIAKNTMLLYARSIIIMLIAIYSSRILISTLGVEDYGLYNLVGGVVSIFSSLKGIFAASVQRFLNFEKGNGNDERVNEIFNTSVLIHIGIAGLFIVLVECFGVWYINNKMVLPEGSLGDALFVFHCSVLAFGVSIITVPYDAVIIANERMNFYAWVSILEAISKLGAIFLLLILPYNKIKTYALLILLIAVIMRYISIVYTKRFPECKKRRVWNKATVAELTKFAGWNFFGCMSFSLIEEGTNLIINLFGGVAANAARAISYQVKSAISQLSTNIVTASQPLLFQEAANAEKSIFWKHVFLQTRAVYYFVLITALPFFVYTPQLLQIWLTEVPVNAVSFVRVVLIYLVVMTFQKPIDLGFKAYNKMQKYQIIDSITVLFSLPLTYVVLKFGAPLYSAFLVLTVIRIIDYIFLLILAKRILQLSIKAFVTEVIIPSAESLIVVAILGASFYFFFNPSQWYWVLLLISILVLLSAIILYIVTFKKAEKELLRSMVISKLKKK